MPRDPFDLDRIQKPQGFSVRNLILSAVLPVGLTIFLFMWVAFYMVIPTLQNNLMESRKEMTRELTNTVWALLKNYEQKVRAGKLSLEEAQQQALSQIRVIQYGPEQKDYFWVNDMHSRMIMHPYRTDLEGQDLTDFRDENGVYLFREFVKTVQEDGQGYVEYLWQWHDDPSRIVSKLSFVKGFEPWGWIIGTGIYIDDVKFNQ